jgi:hypothetical protein
LDHLEEMNGIACLVGLQVADHVPLKLPRALADFELALLNPVFAKEPLAALGRFADGIGWLVFTDRNQRD